MIKQRGLGGLGRGLDALIPAAPAADNGEAVNEIFLTDIVPNKFQPRRIFAQEALQELAESIKQHGILQPIVVRKILTGYELAVGERRWRASQLAGCKTIPAVIREYNDAEMTEIALVENLQRQDLNAIEEAVAYRRLMDEFGLTQEEVARKLGRSRSLIANTVRLLNLHPSVQEHVSRGTLSMGQVKPLLGLDIFENQVVAAETIMEEDLTARDAEELVRRMNATPKEQKQPERPVPRQEIFVVEAEERLRMILGTQVKIKPGKLKSKIEIEFYSADDLDRIIETIFTVPPSVAPLRKTGSLVV